MKTKNRIILPIIFTLLSVIGIFIFSTWIDTQVDRAQTTTSALWITADILASLEDNYASATEVLQTDPTSKEDFFLQKELLNQNWEALLKSVNAADRAEIRNEVVAVQEKMNVFDEVAFFDQSQSLGSQFWDGFNELKEETSRLHQDIRNQLNEDEAALEQYEMYKMLGFIFFFVIIVSSLISIFYNGFKPITDRLQKSTGELDDYINKYNQLQSQYNIIKKKFEAKNSSLIKATQQLKKNTQMLNKLSVERKSIMHQRDRLKNDKEVMLEKLKQKSSAKESAERELNHKQQELSQLVLQNQQLEGQMSNLKDSLDKVQDEFKMKQSELSDIKSKLSVNQDSNSRLSSENQDLKKAADKLQEECDYLEDRLESLKKQQESKESEASSAKAKIEEIESEHKKLTMDFQVLKEESRVIEERLSEKSSQLDSLQLKIDEKDQRITDLSDKNQSLQLDNLRFEQEYKGLQKDLDEKDKQLLVAERQLKESVEKLKTKTDEVESLSEELATASSRLEQAKQEHSDALNKELKRVEELLTENQTLKQSQQGMEFFNNIPDGLWDYDLDSGQFKVSQQLKDILGYNGNNPVKDFDSFMELVHPSEKEEVKNYFNYSINNGTNSINIKCRLKTSKGDFIWTENRGTLERDEASKTKRIIGATSDISIYKEAEERLRTLSLVAEKTDNAVIITDASGRIQWVNEGFEQITEYRLDEVVGKVPGRLLQGKDTNPEDIALLREGIKNKKSVQTEILNYTKSGKPYWLLISISPVFDHQGQLEKYIAVERDITEIKEKEQELARLSLVAAKTDNAVIITDKNGLVEWVNEGFTKMTEYTLEEVVGKKPGHVLQGKNTNPESVQQLRQKLKGRETFSHEIVNYSKSGREYILSLSITPIYENGELVRYIAIESDVTEQRKLEQEIAQAEEDLRNMMEEQFQQSEALMEKEKQLEKALQESKKIQGELKNLSLVASKTDNAVIITDAQGNIEWVNEGFTRITEYRTEEVIGKKPGSFLQGPDTKPEHVRQLRNGLNSRTSFQTEVLNYTKSGKAYWLSISISPVFNEKGEIEKYIAIESDITEKKEQEERLRRLSLVAEKTENAVVITNKDGQIEWVNEGFEKLHGVRKQEITAQRYEALLQTSNADYDGLQDLRDGFSRSHAVKLELHRKDRAGLDQWVSISLSPIYDEVGQVEKYLVIENDITEKKEAQEQIKKLNAVAENSNSAVLITDASGRIEWANDFFEKITEHRLSEVQGRNYDGLLTGPDTSQDASRTLSQAIHSRKPFKTEFLAYTRSRRELWFAASGMPMFDSRGQLERYIFVHHDITETKRKQKELDEAENRVQMLIQEKDRSTDQLRMAEDQLERAKEQIKQRTSEMDVMIDKAPIGICVTNPEGKFVHVNDSYCKIYGYRKEELIGKPFTMVVKPTDIEFWNRKHNMFIEGRDETRGEFNVLTKDGRELHILADSARVMGPEGQPQKITYVIDMTERKKLEQETIESADRLKMLLDEQTQTSQKLADAERQLTDALDKAKQRSHELDIMIDSAPIGICVTTPEGNFEQVNDSYCQIYGYRREELIGKPFTLVVRPSDIDFWKRKHNQFIEGRDETRGEFNVLNKDGKELHILADSARVNGQDGRPRKITYVVDMTARKELEQEIKQSEEQMRRIMDQQFADQERLMKAEKELNTALESAKQRGQEMDVMINSAPIGICVTTPEGNFEQVNDSYCEIYGYNRSELIGKPFTLVVRASDIEFWKRKHDLFIKGQDETRGEFKVVTKSGRELTILADSARVNGPDGRPRKITYVVDLTERKRLEEEIKDSESSMRAIMDDQFAAQERLLVKEKELESALAMSRNLSIVASKTDNAVVITDKNGAIEWVNDGFTRITEYTIEEVVGKKPGSFLQGPDTNPEDKKAIRKGIDSRQPFSHEIYNYSKSGRGYWLSLSITPIFDEQGQLEKFIAIESDVTEQKDREKELQNLSLVASKTDNAVVITDKDGLIEWVNEGFTRITEYTFDEVVGKKPGSFLQGEHTSEEDRRAIRKGIDSKKPFKQEIYNYSKSGRGYWLSLSITPIFDDHGVLSKFIAIESDITEEKEKERELENLSTVASKTDNAVIITDKNGAIEYVNDGFEKITGYKFEEVKGKKPGSFLQGPDTDPKHSSAIRAGLDSKKPFEQEILNYSKKGKPYWLQLSITPVLDADGEVEKFIAIESDITERKAAEEAMQNLSLVASQTDNAVVITDKDGKIEWVNDGFERITEYKFDEVVGKKPGSFLQGDETREEDRKAIRRGLDSKKPFKHEIYNYSKSGRGYWLSISITPIINEEGEIEKFIAIESDISEQKEAEEQMRTLMDQQFAASEELMKKEEALNKALEEQKKKQKELEEATERLKNTQSQMVQNEKMASVGQLTAGIAHEINNPINFVYNGIDSLKMSLDDLMQIIQKYDELDQSADVKKTLEEIEALKKKLRYTRILKNLPEVISDIKNGANRTIEIVKGLRVFSRLDEEEQKLANINEGLESTLILLRNKTKDIIKVRKFFDEHIGEIMCYPGQLNQVFMNLMSNAIQAIPEERKDGELHIYTENLKDSIIIRIMDNGTGIPEDVQKRIFEPFYTTKPVGIGTGLGLSISYGIIEKHGGKIYVNSEVGKGTEFVIELPKEQKLAK